MARDRLLRTIAVTAFAVFLIDRVTKWWVVEALDLASRLRIDVAPPYLNLVMAWNTGINFGLGSGAPDMFRWVLVAVAFAICAALLFWVLRWKKAHIATAVGVVIGGAVGNAWDRVQYGAVADFLNMSCCGIVNPYAFNVADIAIFLGAVVIALRA
ncbi:MAG: signal peptidase II [Pseudomonadota bacterium]